MRVIAIILSILTFTLSTLPCDDEAVVNSEQLTSITQNHSDDNHRDFDLCSPFCSCVCCASIVLELNIQQNNSNLEFSTKELNSHYSAFYSSSFLTQIFQPPQV